MKKMLLSVGALAVGAISFAQNAPEAPVINPLDIVTLQAPTAAAVIPGSPGDANASEVTQEGSSNEAEIYQAGASQSTLVNQASLGSKVFVYQTGMVSPDGGVGNITEVQQTGNYDQATVLQFGDDNSAYVSQVGDASEIADANKVAIQQGGINGQTGERNAASVLQTSSSNEASVAQFADDNTAAVEQTGTNNGVEVRQNAAPNDSNSTPNEIGQVAGVKQSGNDNIGQILQGTEEANGVQSSNRATLVQSGDGNNSFQAQNAYVDEPLDIGDNNNANVFQQGTDGIARQNQLGGSNVAGIQQTVEATDSYADQNQYGEGNNAGIFQYGADGVAFQEQSGNANGASAFQGGEGNYVKQSQYGGSNIANSLQEGTDGLVLQVQNGYQNTSNVDQLSGGENTALTVQNGWNNGSEISQAGEGWNEADVYQQGDWNMSSIAQDGTSNAALVTQFSGQSSMITQTGYGNQANVWQQGAGATQAGPDHERFCIEEMETVPGVTLNPLEHLNLETIGKHN